MKQTFIDTPLGRMIAVADEAKLYLLAFADYADEHYRNLKNQIQSEITSGITEPIRMIKEELKQYFDGILTEFKTPIAIIGTRFQKSVWEKLEQIPLGETRSYADIAKMIGNSKAYSAVGAACRANKLMLIVPCHRVISSDKRIVGYAGGLRNKKLLLIHEFGIKLSA